MSRRPGAFDAWILEAQDQGVDWGEVSSYNDMTKNKEEGE